MSSDGVADSVADAVDADAEDAEEDSDDADVDVDGDGSTAGAVVELSAATGSERSPVSHGRTTPTNRPASRTRPATQSSGLRRRPPPAAVAPAAAKDSRCAPRWSVYSGTSSKRSGW